MFIGAGEIAPLFRAFKVSHVRRYGSPASFDRPLLGEGRKLGGGGTASGEEFWLFECAHVNQRGS